MPDAATVTIPDVPILKVGTWAASTGKVDITTEDLADAVAAAVDPEIDTAPLKLGHTGALAALGDSAPGLGWATNLRLADDGQTLVADYTDVPAALEAPIKAAYKRRSAELAWGVKTVAGKTYRMVLDGLALLGIQAPAVKGLDDLAALYRPAAALASDGLDADTHTLLALYDAPLTGDDPTHVERVANQLRWARESAAGLAALVGLAGLHAVFDALDAMAGPDSRGLLAAAPHHDPVPASSTTGGQMSPKPTLSAEQLATARTKLGLDDSATEEQVIAKLSELDDLVQAAKPTPAPTPAGGEGASTDGAGDGTQVLEPAALSADTIAELTKAGLTILPTPALEQLQANATLGANAASQLAEQRRDGLLDEAERAGKFGVGETAVKIRTALSAQLDTNFDGAKAVIDAMPVIVPVGELGSAGAGPDHTNLAAASAANDAWSRWEAEVFGFETEQKG